MALPSRARHSVDFSTVLWQGRRCSFSPMQAAIVKVLWEALANGTPDVHGSTLVELAGSDLAENRIDPLFFRHAAWKTMIIRGRRRGTYRLHTDKDRATRSKGKKKEKGNFLDLLRLCYKGFLTLLKIFHRARTNRGTRLRGFFPWPTQRVVTNWRLAAMFFKSIRSFANGFLEVKTPKKRVVRRQARPVLEQLEDRTCPSNV